MNPKTDWPNPGTPAAKALREVGIWIACTVIFGLAYTQAPLYYNNQNQYFLHGLASAHRGYLANDWLPQTVDPTPVFSTIVFATARYLDEHLFYLYYLLILGLYCRSMLGIFEFLTAGQLGGMGGLIFVTILTALHAGIFRFLSVKWLGVDYPWYLQSGLAAQYVLGFGLQPSVAGVFLIASIAAFLHQRPLVAAVSTGLAAVIHPTYLLGAAMMTLGYMWVLYREHRGLRAVAVGATTLIIVLPVVVVSFLRFGPTDPATFAEAQNLLVHFRIPHHTMPRIWFDRIALTQVLWFLLALVWVRRTRLFPILAIVFGLSVILTLVQTEMDSDTLALLFPWRTSAILVPLATTIVLSRTLQRVCAPELPAIRRLQKVLKVASIAAMVLLAISGLIAMREGWGYVTPAEEIPLLDYVKSHVQEGETYLLPVELKVPSSGRVGAVSLNFTPPVRRSDPSSPLAVDLQRFRLYTGAPIFVDFKAIAYKDVDVLEWYRRLQWADAAYRVRNWDNTPIVQEARNRGITHVVTAADHDIQCSQWMQVHRDNDYRVYRLPP